MAPLPTLRFLALAFFPSMALPFASIREATPHALELRGMLTGPIKRQDLQLNLQLQQPRATKRSAILA